MLPVACTVKVWGGRCPTFETLALAKCGGGEGSRHRMAHHTKLRTVRGTSHGPLTRLQL